MWSMFGRAGHGGTTECCGNGAPTLCFGWGWSGKLGVMGRRSGVDAMGLVIAWRNSFGPRHDRIFSLARMVSNKRSESELNAFPPCLCRIFPFFRTPNSDLLADSPSV